jgi:hypothetical protein
MRNPPSEEPTLTERSKRVKRRMEGERALSPGISRGSFLAADVLRRGARSARRAVSAARGQRIARSAHREDEPGRRDPEDHRRDERLVS